MSFGGLRGIETRRRSRFGLFAPAIDFNFALGVATVKGRRMSIAALLSSSRNVTAYAQMLNGEWVSFASNRARVTNQGLLMEETRTNAIRNNSMQDAAVGTIGGVGALPTNWNIDNSGGLAFDVVGVGTEAGADYIDLRMYGTSTGTTVAIRSESTTGVAATYGQTWSCSALLKQAPSSAGMSNVNNAQLSFSARNSGGTGINNNGVATITPTNAFQRPSGSWTLPDSPTAFLFFYVVISIVSGVAIDFTLRIGWPQLERNTFCWPGTASASVQNGGTSGTYAINDLLTVQGGAPSTATVLKVTGVSAGQVTSVSVQTAGLYSGAYPPSPASVTGGGGSGATFNLTPNNQNSHAFATSPIRTTNATVTRNLDSYDLSEWLGKYLSTTDGTFVFYGPAPLFSDSSNPVADNVLISLNQGNLQPSIGRYSGGTFQMNDGAGYRASAGSYPGGAPFKVAFTYSKAAGIIHSCLNGGSIGTFSGFAGLTNLNKPYYLARTNWNGYITRMMYFPVFVSDAILKAMTSGAGWLP